MKRNFLLPLVLQSSGAAVTPPPDTPTGHTLDGKTSGDNTDLTPTAVCDAVTGATSYVFEISESPEVNGTTGAFTSAIEVGTPSDPTFTYADILTHLPTTLYSHVAAVGAGGQGAFCSVITINAPMIYPTSGLIFEYNPAKQNYSDTAFATAVTDGQTVGSMRDQSASDIDMTQTTSTARPTWHATDAAALNKPSLEFDGGDYLRKASPSVTLMANRDQFHIIMAVIATSTALNSNDGWTFLSDGNSGNNTPRANFCFNNGLSGRIAFENGSGTVQTGATGFNDGGLHIVDAGRNGSGNGVIRVEGTQYVSSALAKPAVTVDQAALGALWRASVLRVLPAGTKIIRLLVYDTYDASHVAETRMAQEYGVDFSAAASAPDPDPADTVFGFGEDAIGGGNGASVLTVTNLNGSGAGSFKAAVDAVGARKIVFTDLHGWIDQAWTTPQVDQHFLTIAGETAAGDGVGIKRGTFTLAAHHIIARYLKLVPGEGAPEPATIDGLSVILAAHDLFLQHLTIAGSTDELLQIWGSPGDPYKMTLADSIIAGALDNAGHPEGNHAMGELLDRGWYKLSFFRNIRGAGELRDRIPKQVGASGTYEIDRVNEVFVCTDVLPYFVAPMFMNLQGCTFINLTSDQDHAYRLYSPLQADALASEFYANDNRMIKADGSIVAAVPKYDTLDGGFGASIPTPGSRITMPYDGIMEAAEAYTYVLANAGAQRSALEQYLVDRVTNRTTTRINSIADMGGYPTL